jgi:hypothetical protein
MPFHASATESRYQSPAVKDVVLPTAVDGNPVPLILLAENPGQDQSAFLQFALDGFEIQLNVPDFHALVPESEREILGRSSPYLIRAAILLELLKACIGFEEFEDRPAGYNSATMGVELAMTGES